MVRKTLEELKNETKECLTAEDVCGVLGCDPHWVRVTARQSPHWLGFPVIIMNSRVKIPRLAFLRYMGVKDAT